MFSIREQKKTNKKESAFYEFQRQQTILWKMSTSLWLPLSTSMSPKSYMPP